MSENESHFGESDAAFAELTGVLADEIRMYGHAHGTWLPINLARNLTKQLREMGWRVASPTSHDETNESRAGLRGEE